MRSLSEKATKLKASEYLDAAVILSILARGGQALAAAITLLVVARHLSTNEQGYFFTFQSLIAAQTLVDLGLGLAITQACAHEKKSLRTGERGLVLGHRLSRHRVIDIASFSIKWYSCGALLFGLALIPLGPLIFGMGDPNTHVDWKLPWILFVTLAAANLALAPCFALSEGLGRIAETARVRLTQVVVGSVLTWSLAASGLGLYSLVGMQLGMLSVVLIWTLLHNRDLVYQVVLHRSRPRTFEWSEEVGGFQYHLAVSWASGYILFHTLNPLIFMAQGATAAGKFGMSQAICSAIGVLALSWLYAKAPYLGELISRNARHELDTAFQRMLWGSTALAALLSLCVLIALYLLHAMDHQITARLVSTGTFILLIAATLANHVLGALALYIRAHKEERFAKLSVASAATTLIAASCVANSSSELYWVAATYVLVCCLMALPWGVFEFLSFTRKWGPK